MLATAPSEPDAALAFAGLGDLFDQLPSGAVAGLPEPQRRALDAALSVADSDAEPVNPQALPRAALGVLRTLAEAAPVLVAIDDEQWLHRPSARVLAFALCRLTEERVAVLLARRPESGGALWPELTRGFAGDGLQAVTMDPLGLGATRRLLASVLSSPIGRPLLQRVHEASGGNPLYA